MSEKISLDSSGANIFNRFFIQNLLLFVFQIIFIVFRYAKEYIIFDSTKYFYRKTIKISRNAENIY